mgnify:CR=1 FL=1
MPARAHRSLVKPFDPSAVGDIKKGIEAAGLGLNAVVAFQIAAMPEMTWADAMGLVVIEGIIILLLVLTGFREAVFHAIPAQLKTAISVGIGLFITLIGLFAAIYHPVGTAKMGTDPMAVVDPKDLKVRGSSLVIKVGTKVRGIRLVEGDHDIDCRIDGVGAMQLKSEFVRKA